jgi:hypothetical protein
MNCVITVYGTFLAPVVEVHRPLIAEVKVSVLVRGAGEERNLIKLLPLSSLRRIYIYLVVPHPMVMVTVTHADHLVIRRFGRIKSQTITYKPKQVHVDVSRPWRRKSQESVGCGIDDIYGTMFSSSPRFTNTEKEAIA